MSFIPRTHVQVIQQHGLPWPGWSTEWLLDTLPASAAIADAEHAVTLELPGAPHDWYRFEGDGYHDVQKEHLDSLEILADEVGWSLYSAALVSPKPQRIVGLGSSEVTVEP